MGWGSSFGGLGGFRTRKIRVLEAWEALGLTKYEFWRLARLSDSQNTSFGGLGGFQTCKLRVLEAWEAFGLVKFKF